MARATSRTSTGSFSAAAVAAAPAVIPGSDSRPASDAGSEGC